MSLQGPANAQHVHGAKRACLRPCPGPQHHCRVVLTTPCCAGPRGADSTALLPPTDGRMQLLLQPQAGGVGVALHAQLLPLQLSLPAVSALSAAISGVFPSDEPQQQQPQQQQQQQQQARGQPSAGAQQRAQPSPAAVAAAATFIIEDASATLGHHHSGPSAGAAAAPAPAAAHAAAADESPHLDDLAAALFTYVHSSGDPGAASRPAPLQVQTFAGPGAGGGAASRAGGLGARLWAAASGGGTQGEQHVAEQQRRQGVRWCYPQPREVALVAIEVRPLRCLRRPCFAGGVARLECWPAAHACAQPAATLLLDQPLQDPPAALLAAAFQLSCWEPEAGAYLALPLQVVEVDSLAAAVRGSGGGGSSGRTKALLLIAEQDVFQNDKAGRKDRHWG